MRGGHQYLRFELEAIDATTRLCFIQGFGPGYRMPKAILESQEKGFARPAGDDTSWCPGIMAGYELACDALVAFIAEARTEDEIRKASAQMVECANARETLPTPYESDASHGDLVDRYYDYIRDECPAS